MTNGTARSSENQTKCNTWNIYGGTFNGNISSSGYIACGIYAPNYDKWNLYGGTFNITGGAGIVARAGVINIPAESTVEFITTKANADGWVGDKKTALPSSAIVFENRNTVYPGIGYGEAKITIAGGKFKCDEGVKAISYLHEDSDSTERIVVSGGVFSSNPSIDGVTIANGKAVVEFSDSETYKYGVLSEKPTVTVTSTGTLTGAYTNDNTITLTATLPTKEFTFGEQNYNIKYEAKWYKTASEGEEATEVTGEGFTITTNTDSNTSTLSFAGDVKNSAEYTCKVTSSTTEITSESVEVSITKATPTVDISGAAGLTYSKEAQNLLAGTPSTTFGTLTYSLKESEAYVETIPTGTNAGNYTVYYQVAADENGNWDEVKGSVTSITIAKANVTLEEANKPKAAENLKYNGNALNLVTEGTAIGGVGDMQYALDEAEFTTAIPTATDAGTYTVKYKTAANTNYNESAVGEVSVTIAKDTFVDPALPSGLTAEYGKTLTDVNIAETINENGTWSWETDTTTKVGTVDGTNSFKAKFTLNENTAKNYQFDGEATSKTFDVTVAVTAKEVELTWSDTTSLTYNGTDKTPTVSVKNSDLIEGDTLTPTVTVMGEKATDGKAINAGSYTATATLPDDVKNYKLKDDTTTATQAFTIEPVTISSISGIKLTGEASYEYDGKTEVELDCTEATFEGKVDGDTVSITAKGTLDNANVGEHTVTVAKENITLENANGNYELDDDVSVTDTLTVTIKAKALTVSGITATDRVYDGTTDVTLSIGDATLTDILEADNGKVSIESATGTVEDANASETAKTVTVSEVKLTGDSAGNYTVDATKITGITVTISKKSVKVVSGITAKDKVYDGNPNVELDYASAVFDGLAEGESNPTITATGTVEDAYAGENKKVTISNLALDPSVTNYELATEGNQADTTAKISPREVTLTWSDTEFDYDGTLHAPSATVGGLVDSDSETGLSVTVDGAAAEVGTHTAIAKDLTAGDGASATASNYTLPENPTTTFTIKAAKLADDAITTEPKEAKTTTSETGASKTSKETTFTLKLGDGDDEVISVDVAITTDEVFAAKVNEKFSTLVSVDVSLDLGTGIAKDQFSRYVYSIDIVAPEWLNEKSGVLSSDDVANGPYHHEFTLAGTPTTVKNDPIVFTAHIMLSSDNYSNVLTASVDKTVEFNVERGTVVNPTVTIEGWTYGSSSNAPKIEGANEGTYKITYKVKGADDSTSTDKAPTNAGDYTITVVIPSTDDYEGKTVSANFTIAQLEAKLAWSATSFTYNSGDQAPTATVSNLVEGDTCAVTVTVSGDKATDGKAVNAGSYTATATALANANYKLPENASTAFTIAKADITPSVTIADWAHGATASTPVISGNTGNGTVTYLYKSQSGTTAYESATAPTSAGSYTLTITIAET
ncbi:MAG: YDG domain-containing protein, partial [Synergistales bacterium]|nr:YDG domain-containing protein [Synergistales bacterium]